MKLWAILLGAMLAASGATAEDGLPLASVAVPTQEGVDPGFQIEIFADETDIAATREEWRGYRWIAVRTSPLGTDRVGSEACPALTGLADAFLQLPPISPTTRATVVQDEPPPVNLILLHGYGVEIRFSTFGGASVTVTGNDAWAAWGNNVVRELQFCWPTQSR